IRLLFEDPVAMVFVVLAAFGVGFGLLSLRRRSKVRRSCSQATQAIKLNRHEDARRILLAAERTWALNSHDGSRRSIVADLDDFTTILGLLTRLPSPRADTSCISRVETIVAE